MHPVRIITNYLLNETIVALNFLLMLFLLSEILFSGTTYTLITMID
jgi:hypothetical protein